MSMLDTLRHFAMLVVSVQGCAGPAVEGGKATIRSPVLGCPGTGSKFLMVAASLPLYPGHRQCGVFLSPSPFADRQAHERSRACGGVAADQKALPGCARTHHAVTGNRWRVKGGLGLEPRGVRYRCAGDRTERHQRIRRHAATTATGMKRWAVRLAPVIRQCRIRVSADRLPWGMSVPSGARLCLEDCASQHAALGERS